MAFIIGLLLFILGVVVLYAWFPVVIMFLQGLVVFSLLFWGLVSMLIGYASWKGKRTLNAGLNEKPPTSDDDITPTPVA